MTENSNINTRLFNLTALAVDYCNVCETAGESERGEFIDSMLDLLPRIYWEFFDISAEEMVSLEEFPDFSDYVDEDYYESIRRHIEMLLGPDDTFLETFEEDMKYSDTPIAASIAESLADLFQPLFNFASVVKDTEGDRLVDAFIECKAEFENYWSQTLCNVLRALNHVKYRGGEA